ncbi:MAG: hypothetical protein RL385_165 [Pseudomonadota bacterium]
MREQPERSGAKVGEECDACIAAVDDCEPSALRCACGNLMARLLEGRIELKCRRCKRAVYIPLAASDTP